MEKVTIKDVAAKAGVSVNSVSRVMNNRGYISEDLRKKVMKAIDDLDYTPNAIARSFFRSETKSIAFIVPTIANPFFSELAFWIEKELAKHGYHLFIGNSLNDPITEKEYLKMLKEGRIDGLIVGSHNMNIEEYYHIDGNIVSVERKLLENIPMVESDNYEGGKIATKELISKGCKKILHVTGSNIQNTPANNRTLAYLDTIKKYGLKKNVVEIPFMLSESEKIQAIEKLFSSKLTFDGIFADNDIIANNFIITAEKLGINVPKDLKIVGFDGSNQIQTLVPNLTTIVQPIKEMAIQTVNVLLKKINKEKVQKVYTLPVSLKKSGTTAK